MTPHGQLMDARRRRAAAQPPCAAGHYMRRDPAEGPDAPFRCVHCPAERPYENLAARFTLAYAEFVEIYNGGRF